MRLTRRNKVEKALCVKNGTLDCLDHADCNDCEVFEAILDKLERYKDLEEQGRLIEQKHGRWIHKDNFIGKYLMCSECSHVTGRKSTYCPNCGAKMDEVKGD